MLRTRLTEQYGLKAAGESAGLVQEIKPAGEDPARDDQRGGA